MEADNIVFLDDSARVYGSMVFKILKMVKLEYAKIKNISPEEVKIPQVKYINPSSGHAPGVYYIGGETESDIKKLIPDSTTNVIFDESSNVKEGLGIFVNERGKQIDNSVESQYGYREGDTRVTTPVAYGSRHADVTCINVAGVISDATNSTNYPLIGFDGGRHGNFGKIYKEFYGGRDNDYPRMTKSKDIEKEAVEAKLDKICLDLKNILDLIERDPDVNFVSRHIIALDWVRENRKTIEPLELNPSYAEVRAKLIKTIGEEKFNELLKKIREYNGLVSRQGSSSQKWISAVNEDITPEDREKVYNVVNTVAALVIRDIYEKSFAKND